MNPYFRIGEAKYGKPIIDRGAARRPRRSTKPGNARLFQWTRPLRSNLSVGLPLDLPASTRRTTLRVTRFVSDRSRQRLLPDDSPHVGREAASGVRRDPDPDRRSRSRCRRCSASGRWCCIARRWARTASNTNSTPSRPRRLWRRRKRQGAAVGSTAARHNKTYGRKKPATGFAPVAGFRNCVSFSSPSSPFTNLWRMPRLMISWLLEPAFR